jgi:CheY-like chemotaxis protein
MITYTLFLDDVRNPIDECYRSEDVRVVRSSQQAIDLVSQLGLPNIMNLDYHLGDMYPTTMRFMMWLRRQHMEVS